jgi:hypothetical protein
MGAKQYQMPGFKQLQVSRPILHGIKQRTKEKFKVDFLFLSEDMPLFSPFFPILAILFQHS